MEAGSKSPLVLRPEGTAPVMRAVLGGGRAGGGLQRLAYAGPMFRHERPQAWRLRQFTQVGGEIIGSDSPVLDGEAIRAAVDVVGEVTGLPSSALAVKVNSLGTREERAEYEAELSAYFAGCSLSPLSTARVAAGRPLAVLDSKEPADVAVAAAAPCISAHWGADTKARWEAMLDVATAGGVSPQHDARMVRGLDYYNHTAFEVVATVPAAGGEVGTTTPITLAAGGRYDSLATMLGSKTPLPAVGWAAGLERLEGLAPPAPPSSGPLVVLAALTSDLRATTTLVALSKALHEACPTLRQWHDPRVRKPGKVVADASGRQASAVVLVGEDELAAGQATVKFMDSGEQLVAPVHSLSRLLGERCGAERWGL